MYQSTITVFNKYESRTSFLWFPHILTGVDLITDRGQMIQRYGPDNTDNASLHIACAERDGKTIIIDGTTGAPALNTAGEPLSWMPLKMWKEQVNDMLGNTVTFSPGNDFFWLGEWTGGTVNDEDYADRKNDGFYAYMNDKYDFVYQITAVGGPYTLIPHFEILGA